ncbi:MAG: hypothetical protein A2Y77_18175 [Planctomycetes bacterium RBG_13_62_9]|nr:MAG: hypothetical protein A2Y77_18175 [Planctomycetes bacterium RBG_13_62_9]
MVLLWGLETLPPGTVPLAGDTLYMELSQEMEKLSTAGPVFVMENCLVSEVPATTEPKFRLVGETAMRGSLGITVALRVTNRLPCVGSSCVIVSVPVLSPADVPAGGAKVTVMVLL